jgi:hypothetical protein
MARIKKAKRARLEAKGWKVGTVTELMELPPEESALIEIKLALLHRLRERLMKRDRRGRVRKRQLTP